MTDGAGFAGRVRIALVHRDSDAIASVTDALPQGEFDVVAVAGLREVMASGEAAPFDAILVEIDQLLEDSRLFEIGTRGPAFVPVVALAPEDGRGRIAECLDYGADDALVMPAAGAILATKLRALLRLVRNSQAASRRRHRISGAVGDGGTLALVKHCEDQRLTGRLTVTTREASMWVDFLGGAVLESGDTSHTSSLDALLAARRGTYVIEQAPLAPLGAAAVPDVTSPASSQRPAPPLPETHTTEVAVAPHLPPYRVVTESDNRPNFTITTTVWRGQQILRRVRTAWQHPLEDQDDLARATSQVDEQHERARRSLADLVAEPEPSAAHVPDTIDGTLLSWAVLFVVDQAWGHLGTTITSTLLRRTQESLSGEHPSLSGFHVGEHARVELDPAAARLPQEAVVSVAEWLAAFLAAGRSVVSDVGRVNVRQATTLMSHALERVGFYAAYERAVERWAPSPDDEH